MTKKALALAVIFAATFNYSFAQNQKTIPFTLAQNYFVKTTFKQNDWSSHIVTSSAVFDTIFGSGAVMGSNGIPTPIDFDKQFVIAFIHGETSVETSLIPERLVKVGKKKMLFEFNTLLGATQTYSSIPFLLLIVDKKYKNYSIEYLTHAVL